MRSVYAGNHDLIALDRSPTSAASRVARRSLRGRERPRPRRARLPGLLPHGRPTGWDRHGARVARRPAAVCARRRRGRARAGARGAGVAGSTGPSSSDIHTSPMPGTARGTVAASPGAGFRSRPTARRCSIQAQSGSRESAVSALAAWCSTRRVHGRLSMPSAMTCEATGAHCAARASQPNRRISRPPCRDRSCATCGGSKQGFAGDCGPDASATTRLCGPVPERTADASRECLRTWFDHHGGDEPLVIAGHTSDGPFGATPRVPQRLAVTSGARVRPSIFRPLASVDCPRAVTRYFPAFVGQTVKVILAV